MNSPNMIMHEIKLRFLFSLLLAISRETKPKITFKMWNESFIPMEEIILLGASWMEVRYDTYDGVNLVTWQSKKQKVILSSSAEAEWHTTTNTYHEMVWLQFK